MKHYYIFLLILASILLSCSCAKQSDAGNLEDSEEVVSLRTSKNSDYQPHRINEVVSGDYQKYMEYFEGTDYEIGISSSKDGGLPGGSSISCISGISHIRKENSAKASPIELPAMKSFVDGIEISPQSFSQTKASNSIMNCFGKTVKFTFSHNIETKSSDGDTGEAEMYVPAAIEFTFPYAESEEDLNPLCYFKDFIIRWNKDEGNKNGVLVVVDWTGSMVLGNDIPDTHVCRLVKFPDTGEARLSESIFNGIPDTAFCNLMILRGNVENIEQEQYTYKLIGKTHHQISFILIREIDKKQQ